MKASSPIGVFDSGLGGLTVLKALRKKLPHEDFIYLGDLARLPYGTKSESCVTRYSEKCVDFLLQKKAKVVVIACGTASALALKHLEGKLSVPVFGVIEAMVNHTLLLPNLEKILVLATEAAVRSEAYQQLFFQKAREKKVTALPAPLLVSLAEAGWWDHPITVSVIREYLKEFTTEKWDAVCLGCTHYPLLLPSFHKVFPAETQLMESGPAIALDVESFLRGSNLLNAKSESGEISIYSTDKISPALPILRFLEEEIRSLDYIHLE